MGMSLNLDLDITGLARGLAPGIPFCSLARDLLGFFWSCKVAAGVGSTGLDLATFVASIEGSKVLPLEIVMRGGSLNALIVEVQDLFEFGKSGGKLLEGAGGPQSGIQVETGTKVILHSGLDNSTECGIYEPAGSIKLIVVGAELSEVGVNILVAGLSASAEIIQ
ncbi:hypothetical protein CALVIDRAFT_525723 [Calocera viscosa TUFC12733]|uniref:Uncharacterized protein n=1 Tax=Calocera viscosa (strain TUFC12733) TaxID=1330018 RepID=A0A167PZ60_CALVF|nr:hypothetical protein CALVIDRAFT_525723 [Calocera viscosa TUFC12733]